MSAYIPDQKGDQEIIEGGASRPECNTVREGALQQRIVPEGLSVAGSWAQLFL